MTESKSISSSTGKTCGKDRAKKEPGTGVLPKTKRKEKLKPHYLTGLDAAAKSKGHVYYSYGCEYCEDRHREIKAARYKMWKKEAALNGVELVAEHDYLVESVRMEIDKSKLEEGFAEPHQKLCMGDIVRLREEAGYVVSDQGKKKGRSSRKERVVVEEEEEGLIAVDNSGPSRDGKNNDDIGSVEDWEDLEWDTSDESGSLWIEAFSNDGKVQ